jgi:hypothetical protein
MNADVNSQQMIFLTHRLKDSDRNKTEDFLRFDIKSVANKFSVVDTSVY